MGGGSAARAWSGQALAIRTSATVQSGDARLRAAIQPARPTLLALIPRTTPAIPTDGTPRSLYSRYVRESVPGTRSRGCSTCFGVSAPTKRASETGVSREGDTASERLRFEQTQAWALGAIGEQPTAL